MSDFAACPCCGYRTLNERAAYEICPICWWEDDGQDDADADADTVRGGPNGEYSLALARANFADHFDMYDAGKGIGAVARPSSERKALLAWLNTVREGTPFDERKLHALLRAWADADRKRLS